MIKEHPDGKYKVSLYYGKTEYWWHQAIYYYKVQHPNIDLLEPFFPPGFWEHGGGYSQPKEKIFDFQSRKILNFWHSHPAQAEMLLP